MSDRVEELLEEAWEMENGREKVALLEEAVREADALGDVGLAYYVRMELIDAAAFSGFHERSLVAFSWCLARYDESPDEYDEEDLFWKYKWIIDALWIFPQVTRQQIEEMQDDMERRFEILGYSLRPVHYFRFSNAMRMGYLDEAIESYEKARRTERDWMADCEACELEKQVELLARLRRDEEMLQTAVPILTGKMSCAEIPHLTYATILRPLMRMNRREEALEAHRKGYRLTSTNAEFLRGIADHLLFLVAENDLDKAVRLFEKHLPWTVETGSLHARFCFYSVSTQFLDAVTRSHPGSRKLVLPSILPCFRQDGEYDPGELTKWFDAEARSLAKQFNQRNGNDYYDQYHEESRQLAWLG